LTVVLSGNDGDENWSGSQRTAPEGIGGRLWDLAPASIRRPIFNALSALYSRNDWLPASGFHEARRGEVTDPTTAYLNSLYGSLAGERRTILGRDLQSRLNGYNPFESFFDHGQRPRTDDPMARVRYLDLKTRLTDDLLTKIDRASMAVSLEVRCPLLDHQFLGLMARIPSNLIMRGREGKYIFRRAVSKLLPPEIVSRPKMGMVLPLADWLRGDLYQLSNSLLFDSAAHDGLLDRAAVAKLWKQHQSKSGDNSRVLWAILMFRMWQRNFAKR
ncbi:MAG TPA: asparagine synthase C-terminal domain-containing protein, partial [Blastocatellia bacterium]|nr:asparagine synthase C-terminal domain-containing protein [Blastocatellia bacterium]